MQTYPCIHSLTSCNATICNHCCNPVVLLLAARREVLDTSADCGLLMVDLGLLDALLAPLPKPPTVSDAIEALRGLTAGEATVGDSAFLLAAPSSTLRARAANSRLHFVSGTFSTAGLQFTTMSILLLPPSESSSSLVNCSRANKHPSQASTSNQCG